MDRCPWLILLMRSLGHGIILSHLETHCSNLSHLVIYYQNCRQKEKAKKISPISVTDDRSIASDVVSIPSTSSKDPPLVAGKLTYLFVQCWLKFGSLFYLIGPIHNIPSIDKKVPPKFGQHRPPPDHFWCSLLLSKTPRRIFVRIHDEELERFNLMSAKMQEVYQSMSNVSREAKHLKIGSIQCCTKNLSPANCF